MGRGGTVLASFRWIFQLNASGTGLPSDTDSAMGSNSDRQDEK